MSTAFIIQTAAAAIRTCWGVYRRVAVLEVEVDAEGEPVGVAMISERARGVVRIVETWEACNVGKVHRRGGAGRCAYSRALVEAEATLAGLVAS